MQAFLATQTSWLRFQAALRSEDKRLVGARFRLGTWNPPSVESFGVVSPLRPESFMRETNGQSQPPPLRDLDRDGASTRLERARQAQGGDRTALVSLVRDHALLLRRLLRIRSGVPGIDVEPLDLLPELLLTPGSMRRRPRTEPGVVLWLSDLLAESLRARSNRTGGQRPSLQRAPKDDHPAGKEQRIEACLADLDPLERDVLLLHECLGATWDDVTLELALPSLRVHELHLLARLQLARQLRSDVDPCP